MSRSGKVSAALAGVLLSGLAWTVAPVAPVASAADNPRAVITSPSTGAGVDTGVPLLITGIAFNGEAGGIIAVEVTFDGGTSWQLAGDAETWAITHTPDTAGPLTIQARASTASVVGVPTPVVTLVVGAAGSPPSLSCPCTLWPPTLPDRPVIQDPDQEPVELGLRIRPDRDGTLASLTVRRGTWTGPLIGRVWSGAGTLLAEQQVPAGTAAYRVITFATPAVLTAGSEYVVSYYTPAGGYAATEDYFSGTLAMAPFVAPHDGVRGAGVYHYGVGGGFPADSWRDSNYWLMPTLTT
ncbi:MAG TPA: DUF4082 domain-containing protein [Pseudonocardiaceae bacterium]